MPKMPSTVKELTPTEMAAATSTNEAPSSTTPQTASQLPPAALDLAGKLFDYARAGSTAELLQYVQAGIPPNLTNSAGDTLLMLASYHGHAETVSSLLAAGADPNIINGRGQSPIAGAVFKGYDEVVRVLYEGVGEGDSRVRADVRSGQPTAVDCARMFKRDEMLKLFGVEGESATPWADGTNGDDRVNGANGSNGA
jgi:ankyrin repeat protein